MTDADVTRGVAEFVLRKPHFTHILCFAGITSDGTTRLERVEKRAALRDVCAEPNERQERPVFEGYEGLDWTKIKQQDSFYWVSLDNTSKLKQAVIENHENVVKDAPEVHSLAVAISEAVKICQSLVDWAQEPSVTKKRLPNNN